MTEKQSLAQKKRFEDPEERKKLSKAGKGRPHTEEHCRKIGEGLKGHIVSEDTRRIISEKAKERLKDPDRRRIIGDANKRRVWLKESRIKLGNANSGERCHLWKGGVSFEPYCVKFNREFKERVRAFFDHKCVECGTPQNGERLHVHHVNFNKNTCCDSTAPLFVALCHSCHSATNNNRPYWEQHFIEMINGFYDGRCYFTKEEMITNV